MERRDDYEPIANIQKTIKRQKFKKNHINQQRDNIIPDTVGIEENIIKHEKTDRNRHDLGDELSNQKLSNQPFLFKGSFDLDSKLVEIIMPFKSIEVFKNYLESVDEHYDKSSIIGQEADIFKETDKKIFDKVNKSDFGKRSNIIDKNSLHIKAEVVIYQENL